MMRSALCSICVLSGGCLAPRTTTLHEVDARIAYYEQRVALHPRLYPAYANLGGAFLQRARRTHNPADLRQARSALARSLEIQPSLQGFVTMAAVCNYSHRFAEAADWAHKAVEAAPNDSAAKAQLVEAYLGLGRLQDAQQVVAQAGEPEHDFHLLVAQANILVAGGQTREAASTFARAAEEAAPQAQDMAVWARVRAAGVLLDAGDAKVARPYLEAAAKTDANDFFVRLHSAELAEIERRLDDASKAYERLLAECPDPAVHAKAFSVARRMKRDRAARRHFEAAEAGFQAAIDAGEVYTLGALADLYAQAEVKLDRALALANENLKYKRDAQALDTHARIERLLATRQ
jgi:tetratricopeptide (TPR) repeat protein